MRLAIKDYRHWRFKYELMRFGVLLLVVILFWIGIELYSTYISTEVEEDYLVQIKPLNPALDLDMLEDLSQRTDSPSDFAIALPSSQPSTLLPTPKPSSSSLPQPDLIATNSGSL